MLAVFLLAIFIYCMWVHEWYDKHLYSLNHPPDPLSIFINGLYMRVHIQMVCLYVPIQPRRWHCIPYGCDLPCGCMKCNQDPLEEQPLLVNSWAMSPACFIVFWDKVLQSSCHVSGLHHHCWFICLFLFLRCYHRQLVTFKEESQ